MNFFPFAVSLHQRFSPAWVFPLVAALCMFWFNASSKSGSGPLIVAGSPAKTENGLLSEALLAPCSPAVSVSPLSPSYCPGGSVVLTASNAITYTWSPNTALSSTTGATVTAAPTVTTTYTVTGTGTAGCTGTATVVVTVKTRPVVSVVPVSPPCGSSTGSITTTVSGATSPYSFAWSNGATVQSPTNLAAGIFVVTVTSANGCTAGAVTTVRATSTATISVSTSNSSCNSSNGTATLTISGGVSPYTFLWNNGTTVQNLTNVTANSYSVTLTDANGCTKAANASIGGTPGANLTLTVTQPTCTTPTGGVSVTASGGGGSITYLWSNGATGASVTNLAPGFYSVTASSSNGCKSSESVYLNPQGTIFGAATVTPTACGNSGGAATVNISAGVWPYTYLWSTGETIASISNKPAGMYTVTVSSINGCTAADNITIPDVGAPSLVTNVLSNASCNLSNGSAEVVATGSAAPYSYLWSNGATTASVGSLAGGTYTVTVSGTNACPGTTSVSIANTLPPVVSLTATGNTCGNPNGSVSANITSGNTAPLSFIWNNAATTQNISGLSSGTYTLTVTNGDGCTASANASVTNSAGPVFTLTSVNASCGLSNGSVSINTFSNGTAPFNYTWSNGATTSGLTGAGAGTYSLTVTDANGCTYAQSRSITNTTVPTVTLTPTNATCGLNNGSISAIGGGATAPYSCLWSNGATTATAASLAAGSYSVTVTSANGCTVSDNATVAAITPPSLSETHTNTTCNSANGSVSLTVNNGTPPLSFSWNNGATTQNLSNIPAANYTVTVTDANSCTATLSVSITNAPPPTLSFGSTSSTCGNANGSVNATVSSGTSPFTFIWSNGATTQNLSNVGAATYSLTVTDANGCTASGSRSVTNIPGATIALIPVNASCGLSNGSVSSSLTGGTAPFGYSWSNGGTLSSLSSIPDGAYSLTVTDANGCTSAQSTTLSTTLVPTLSATATNSTCAQSNGTLLANASDAVAPYSFIWSDVATSASRTSVAPGTYSVTTTSANGCTASASATVTAIAPPTLSQTHVNTTCNLSNGLVDLTVNNGTAPFTFAWSSGATTEDLSGISSGTYTVTVADANSCTATLSVSITNAPPSSVTLTAVSSVCGGANGSISTVVSGNAPYGYLWNTGATTQNINALVAGTYTVTVTDVNSCTTTVSKTVSNISGPDLTITPVNATCGVSNGSVSSSLSNGTAPFTYNWSNGGTTSSISNLADGMYSLTVTDANGCTAVQSTTVTITTVPVIGISTTSTTCGLNNGTATSIVSGATAPYSYTWSNGTTNTSLSTAGTGVYSLTVTSANGCSASASATVTAIAPPTLTRTYTNTTCGNANGSINLTVSNGTAPFTFVWNNGATTQNLTAIPAAIYVVTVTDANSCTATLSRVITNAPSPTVTLSSNTATCGSANGSVTATVSSGTAPFTFLWSNGTTTQNLTNVAASDYTVTVTDNNNCTAVATASVGNIAGPVLSIIPYNATCGLTNGSIGTSLWDGTAPYAFAWSNGSTNGSVANLGAGTYSVTVTDANNCTHSQSTDLSAATAPTVSVSVVNTTCGLSNGSITASPASGTPAYTFLWSTSATTSAINNKPPGTYTVTVTDAAGCTVSKSASIASSLVPQVSLSPVNPSCAQSNGTISANITQATAPYTYQWSNGATTSIVSGLPAGTYSITITDANACTASATTSLTTTQPPVAIATPVATTCGLNNGSVGLTASGGVAPYSYLWSTGATTQNISNKSAASYSVTVTDAMGCTVSANAVVGSSLPLALSLTPVASSCNLPNGSITSSVTDGTPGYAYAWSNGATTSTLSNVPAGSYNLTVNDIIGCSASAFATVTTTTPVSLNNPTTTSATCNQTNGSATITVAGGVGPFDYLWSNGQTTATSFDLFAGSYTVTVTSANGCSAMKTANVSNATGPVITAGVIDNETCSASNGKANVTIASGGVSPFTYNWSNGVSTASVSGLSEGTYNITVTDATGCVATDNVVITNAPAPLVTVAPSQSTCGNSNGLVALQLNTGYTAPLAFSWSNGATTQNLPGVSSGSYSVTVTDGNGCSANASAIVNNASGPVFTLSKTDATCMQNNGSVSIATMTGGIAPFVYTWSNGTTDENLTAVGTGNYTLTVTDANNCTFSQTIAVQNSTLPVLSLNATSATCDLNNGSVISSTSDGTTPYSYQWSNGSTAADIQTLSTGSYSLTVTDAKGCTASAGATVQAIAPPALEETHVNATCNGSNALVDVNVVNGSSPFAFEWSNGATNEDLTNITSGSYSVTVSDANACTAALTVSVSNAAPPQVVLSASTATCGYNNGLVSTSVSSGTAPFSFIWNNGSTEENLTDVAAGIYAVTVTDANGCSAASTATVNDTPVPAASVAVDNSTCGESNGSANAIVSVAGTAPYSFNWSDGSTLQNISDIPAGNYNVTITDTHGCTATAGAIVSDESGPTFTALVNHSSCGLSNGSVVIAASGGTAPLSFSWSNGDISENISNLTEGTYWLTVTDANNCQFTDSVMVNGTVNPVIQTAASNETCGNANGSVTTVVSEGTAPFSFSWSNGLTSQNIENLIGGVYKVTVTDAAGCTAQATATVENETAAVINLIANHETCSAANGSIVATITGNGPFAMLWSNGSTESTIDTLAAGAYNLTVTDNNGCTSENSVSLTNAASPSISIATTSSTCGLPNGQASATITGGLTPFAFNWSNGETTQDITSVTAGAYTLTVTDANGCTSAANGTVTNLASPVLSAGVSMATCGNANGLVDVTVSDGAAPFNFLWSNASTTEDIANIASGNYSVTVTDANNCTSSISINVQNADGPELTLAAQNSTCGYLNGAVNVTLTGGVSPYVFAWSNGSSEDHLSNITAGTYSVTVTDANECVAIQSISITTTSPPVVALVITNETCGAANGTGIPELSGNGPFSCAWSNGSTEASLNNAAAGSYTMTVTDAVGCTAVNTTTIENIQGPSVALEPAATTCNLANGSVQSVISGGTAPFSYLWSDNSTTENISDLFAGVYELTVTDGNGCSEEVNITVINIPCAPDLQATATNALCGLSNGSVGLEITGGTPPFACLWNNGATTKDLSSIPAGNYTVTVTDGASKVATQSVVVGNTGNPPVLVLHPVGATCFQSDGAVTVDVISEALSFGFAWSNGSTTQHLQSIHSGTYDVSVTDNIGCSAHASAVVINGSAPTVTVTATNAACQNDNGTVEASITGGTQPYQFIWNTGATAQNISGLPAGAYALTVTDATGCQNQAAATITQPQPPTVSSSVTNATCGSPNGSVIVAMNGGVAPFSYQWSNAATTKDLVNVIDNVYTITATDANGCTVTQTSVVTNTTVPTISSSSIDHATCDLSNGAITLQIAGGTTPYAFQWSNGMTSQDAEMLAAGDYNVTITDSHNCSLVQSYTVANNSGPSLALQSSAATCGQADGNVELTINGGTVPMQFSWNNGSTTQHLNNVPAGNYFVTATDASGCTVLGYTSITNANGPQLSQSTTNATCNQTNGAVSIYVTGGLTPYTYVWNNGSTVQNRSNLAAGVYSVTVSDASGCQAFANITVNNTGNITLTSVATPSTCGNPNGSVNLTASSSAAPYSFIWSNGATTEDIAAVMNGTYNVTVTNALGCTATKASVVSAVGVPSLSHNVTPATCALPNGSIHAYAGNGSASYAFTWNNGSTTSSLINYPSGNYTVTVTDANGCSVTQIIALTSVAVPTVNATATSATCGNANGTLQATFTTGASGGSFLWSNGSTSGDVQGVAAGVYNVTVTDANSCTATATATVNAQQPPVLSAASTPTMCSTGNGTINLTVTGGAVPFTYIWSNGNTTTNISGLVAGTYTVTVTDANNCTAVLSQNVSPVAGPTVQLTSTNTTCGGFNGTVASLVSGGLQPYTYAWNNGHTTQQLSNTVSGNYVLTVVDANGCSGSASAIVQGSTMPFTSLSKGNATCSQSNGWIVANTQQGVMPYSFSWNNGESSAVLSNLVAGDYTVTITDAAGCSLTANTTIANLAAPTVTTYINNAACGQSNGHVTLGVQGGTAPFAFTWSTGATADHLAGVASGTYGVTVTDLFGCSISANALVAELNGPSLTIASIPESCGMNNGKLIVNTTGGTAPFSYAWSNGQSLHQLTNAAYGNYTVTVTDYNGCTASIIGGVDSVGRPTVALHTVHETCFAQNGLVDAAVVNGTAPYQYAWNNGVTAAGLQNVDAGIYAVTVTDANGCTVAKQTNVIAVPVATLQLSALPQVLCEGSETMITASGNATYSWAPAAGLASTSAAVNYVTAVSPMQYTVTGTDANGCTTRAMFSVNPVPNAVATISSSPFEGCAGSEINLSSVTSDAVAVKWFAGNERIADHDTLFYPQPGTHSITLVAVSPYGCNDTVTLPAFLKVYPKPQSGFTWKTNPGVTGLFEFNTTSVEPLVHTWKFCDDCAGTGPAATHTYDAPGTYAVTLTETNEFGCADTVTDSVSTNWPLSLYAPNLFTPDGDGHNDLFMIYSTGVKSMRLRIFDRIGQCVFDGTGLAPAWDGTFRGKEMDWGVFVFVAEVDFWDGRHARKTGDVTMLR